MYKPAVEDLQQHIYELKKQLYELREENHLYKVKIRKLQDEVKKRDKQMELMLDPKRASNIKKILTQHGAALVLQLRESNTALQREIDEKNQVIKKLQSHIDTMKLYCNDRSIQTNVFTTSNRQLNTGDDRRHIDDTHPEELSRAPSATRKDRRSKSVSTQRQSSRPNSPRRKNSDTYSNLIHQNYISMLNTNLELIKNNKENQESSCQSPCSSIPSTTGSRDTPHEEIQQLQGCLLNVLTEVDSLKDTIGFLKEEQQKTHNVLEQKNSNIERLAHEIENLKSHHKLSAYSKLLKAEDDTDLSTIVEKSTTEPCFERQESSTDETNETSKIELCAKQSAKNLKEVKASVCVQTIRPVAYSRKIIEPSNVNKLVSRKSGGYNINVYTLEVEDSV